MNWNRTVLDYLKNYVDYISLHLYVGNRDNDYYRFMTSTLDLERNIKIVKSQITEAMIKAHRDHPIYIAFDEYNVWYRAFNDQHLEEHYNLEDALVIAQFLNTFIRNADVVKMANMAQLVNVIAPLMISNDSLFYQTIFYPLQLFANNVKGESIDNYVDCGTFKTGDHEAVPYLDVSSAYDKDHHQLILNIVNRDKEHALPAAIISEEGKFSGNAEIFTVNGKDIKDTNSTTEQKVKTVTSGMKVSGTEFNYSFPAHSFTMIRVSVVD
jgi:alpha-N-arabinofuranosidase